MTAWIEQMAGHLALAVGLAFGWAVFTTAGGEVFLGSWADSEGNRLQWSAPEAAIADTPAWDGQAPLPFDLEALLKRAREYANQLAGVEGLPLQAFYLQRADRAGRREALYQRWFLTVKFGGAAQSTPAAAVRMLMDGTVVEPVAPAD